MYGYFKFGNNTYPRRIRRRWNLGHIFLEKRCVLWAGKYGKWCDLYAGQLRKKYTLYTLIIFLFYHEATAPSGSRPPHCRGFVITLRHTKVGRTLLDEWSARRRDLYLTTHNTQQQTDIHAPGGIRTHNPSKRSAADPRLRPRGNWDRPHNTGLFKMIVGVLTTRDTQYTWDRSI